MLPRRPLRLLNHPLRLLLLKGAGLGGCGVLMLRGAGKMFLGLEHSFLLFLCLMVE